MNINLRHASLSLFAAALLQASGPAFGSVSNFTELTSHFTNLQISADDVAQMKTFFESTLPSAQSTTKRLPFSGDESQATYRIVFNVSRYLARQEEYLDNRQDELTTANLALLKQRRADMQAALFLATFRLFFAASDSSERCLRIQSAGQIFATLDAGAVKLSQADLQSSLKTALDNAFIKSELANKTACKFTERKSQSAEKEEIENTVLDQLKSKVAAALRLINESMTGKVLEFKELLDRAQKSIPSRTKEILELQSAVDAAQSNAELIRDDSFEVEGKLKSVTAPKDPNKPDEIDLTNPGSRIESEIRRIVNEGPGEVKRAQVKLKESFGGYFGFIKDTLYYLATQKNSVCAPGDGTCLSSCEVLKKEYLDNGKLESSLAPFDGTPVAVETDPITVLKAVSEVYESCLSDFRKRISQDLPKTDEELIQEAFAKELGAISPSIIK